MFDEHPRVDADPEIIARLKRVRPSTPGHVTDLIFLRSLTPSCRPLTLVGPAVVVRIPRLDLTAGHCVLDVVRPGGVVVVDPEVMER